MAQSRRAAAGACAMTASPFADSVRRPTACFIGGDWRAAAGGATLALEDPSDGSELARIARGGAADIDAAVAAARAALDGAPGAGSSAAERGRMLARDRPQGARQRRAARRARGARRRQAAQAGARRRDRARALPRVLRRRRRQGARRDAPLPARLHRADAARAARRHRPHRARGTTRCRSSAAASARRSRWATPAC